MEKIRIKDAPTPAGHYSHGIVHNGFVFVSGQLPVNPWTGEVENGSIEAQTELALKNVEAVLRAAGTDLKSVVQMTIYISDIELWGKVNEVYARILGEHRPARAIVPVKDLHFDTKIEIQAIAAVED
ncbi:MAG TPA: Rid family detoxifying hydrolase [Pyrinomonadaceae bacterium]|nr:Rid family detoxifying hydrolase [Pyrinomonadaceae bacterium]